MKLKDLYVDEALAGSSVLTVAFVVTLWHTLKGSKFNLVLVQVSLLLVFNLVFIAYAITDY
jgi:ABC-type uncharacterized transport system fused permease/ATPase subunit